MTSFDFWMTIFSDHTVRIVTLGAMILGITAGCLGSFTVLRQQSLLGDAISHATLPGVGLAFLLTEDKSPLVLLIGAAIAGWLGIVMVMAIPRITRIKLDTALGMILSVFFGLGLVLLTIIQKLPTATKAGLNKFLFGSAATLLQADAVTMAVIGFIVIFLLLACWKEFKIMVFDYDFAQSLGLRVHFLDVFLTTLIVITIVIGLQMVGVVLMSAMLVAPAAAARQWTDNLGKMVCLSAIFGASAGVAGAVTSSLMTHLPTGPTIVLYISFIVLVSLLFAPNRGLLWDWVRTQRSRREIQTTAMLKNLLLFSESQSNPFHPHDIAALRAIGRGAVNKTMFELKKKGLVQSFDGHHWALTAQGLKVARHLTKKYEGNFDVDATD